MNNRTFKAVWSSVHSPSDPIMRDGDIVQRFYWKCRNAVFYALSAGRAYRICNTLLLSAYIVPKGAKAVLNVYAGNSFVWRGKSIGKTLKWSIPFPYLDADFAIDLSKRFG